MFDPSTLTVRQFDRRAVLPPRIVADGSPWLTSGHPLDLEIGCGVGYHPIQYAIQNPERVLIAIEHTREKFLSFERRIKSHQAARRDSLRRSSPLANLYPVHANAIGFVTHVLPNESVDRIFLLYPNPEPKAANKRWFRMPFFGELLAKLKPGGTILLATNIESYEREAKQYALGMWRLKIIREAELKGLKATPAARSHFEKKYLERGETCYDVTFMKSNACVSTGVEGDP